VPQGTKNFESPALLDDVERFRALSTKGVADATPILVSFAQWRPSGGGATPIFVVGSDPKRPGLHPWNLIEGNLNSLSVPDAVAVDQSYFHQLGAKGQGDVAEIRGQKAQIQAVTRGIRSFTTTPFVFTTLARARTYTGIPANKATYLLVHLSPGADVASVRAALQKTLVNAEALTPAEFSNRSRSFWLFGTGAGFALFGGAVLGMIVGTVIVAQTLYSSTKDHLNEFATLRAIGSSGAYIYTVIIIQALLSAVIGFCIAAAVGLGVVAATAESALPVFMTPTLMASLFALTVAMCVISAVSAILKVMRVDPAMVFTR